MPIDMDPPLAGLYDAMETLVVAITHLENERYELQQSNSRLQLRLAASLADEARWRWCVEHRVWPVVRNCEQGDHDWTEWYIPPSVTGFLTPEAAVDSAMEKEG